MDLKFRYGAHSANTPAGVITFDKTTKRIYVADDVMHATVNDLANNGSAFADDAAAAAAGYKKIATVDGYAIYAPDTVGKSYKVELKQVTSPAVNPTVTTANGVTTETYTYVLKSHPSYEAAGSETWTTECEFTTTNSFETYTSGNGVTMSTVDSGNDAGKTKIDATTYKLVYVAPVTTQGSEAPGYWKVQKNDGTGWADDSDSDEITTYTKTEIDGLISSINQFKYEVVPHVGTNTFAQDVTAAGLTPATNVLYLNGPFTSVTGDDKYDEYVCTDATTPTYVKIGETTIDLSGYATQEYVQNYVKDGALKVLNEGTGESAQTIFTANQSGDTTLNLQGLKFTSTTVGQTTTNTLALVWDSYDTTA